MPHIAQIDENNKVTQVIVVMDEYPKEVIEEIEGKKVKKTIMITPEEWATENLGGSWVKTSYNTRAGKHYGEDGKEDNKPAIRKNYAGVGFTYDKGRDAFIPPKPEGDFELDEETCTWKKK